MTIAYLAGGIILLLGFWLPGIKEKRTVEIKAKIILLMLSVAAVLCIYLPLCVQGVRRFPAAVYFPVLNAGIAANASVVGILWFKDKLKPAQLAGIVSGLAAIVLLTI